MTRRLLDVGCGDGTTAIDRGWHNHYDYVGLDIDDDALTAAQTRGLDARKHDATSGLDFPDGEFDRVVCKAILEHVPDPLDVARECKRVLKPGGELLAIVPSDRSYDVWGDYTHLRAFREDAFRDLLKDAGFEDIRISPRMGWDSPGVVVRSLVRMAAPWTPYGYPRAWEATVRAPREVGR